MISSNFSLFWQKKHFTFCQMCFIRRTVAYLCLNINFHAVDFSERRSEEVISLFFLIQIGDIKRIP